MSNYKRYQKQPSHSDVDIFFHETHYLRPKPPASFHHPRAKSSGSFVQSLLEPGKIFMANGAGALASLNWVGYRAMARAKWASTPSVSAGERPSTDVRSRPPTALSKHYTSRPAMLTGTCANNVLINQIPPTTRAGSPPPFYRLARKCTAVYATNSNPRTNSPQ